MNFWTSQHQFKSRWSCLVSTCDEYRGEKACRRKDEKQNRKRSSDIGPWNFARPHALINRRTSHDDGMSTRGTLYHSVHNWWAVVLPWLCQSQSVHRLLSQNNLKLTSFYSISRRNISPRKSMKGQYSDKQKGVFSNLASSRFCAYQMLTMYYY